MHWSPAGKGVAVAAAAFAVAALVTLALIGGFAFYAPPLGEVAAGEAAVAAPEAPRNRVRVVTEAKMAQPGAARPTLADVAAFYALESDTLACTVRANHGAEVPDERLARYVRRPLAPGDDVVLCLD